MGRAFEFRKARKFKRWGQMAKTFTRIGREIAMAVKESGPNPDSNSRLRAAMQNAKAANMPKDNVERAIKRATSKDQEDFKQVVFEGYGPHGVAVLVECATDNNNRTVAAVRSYFTRSGGSLGTSGSVDYLFEHKCYFKIDSGEYDIEELELELIDYGAEEVFEEEDGVMIYGSFEAYGQVQNFLEENSYSINNSGFERIPLSTKELNEEQQEELRKMLDKFDDDDDVLNVYHTMAE